MKKTFDLTPFEDDLLVKVNSKSQNESLIRKQN